MEKAISEGLTFFSFPATHHRRIRTNNIMEYRNQEIKRRTRVVRLFPNEDSCLRLISAMLMEISEDYETERTYLSLSEDKVE